MFGLGTTAENITSLHALGVGDPTRAPYQPYSAQITLADGTVRGVGFPKTSWFWNNLSSAQREILRTYCTGASSEIYITTKINDSDTYTTYQAVMVWPLSETRVGGNRQDFTIEFQRMIPV